MQTTETTPESAVPEGISGRLIRKNLSAIGLSYAVAAAAGFVAQAYVARQLGRSVFGVYIAALSLVSIVKVIDRLGRTEYVVREASRDRGRLPQLVGDMLFLKLLATAAGVAVAVGAAAVLGFGGTGIAVAGLLALMAGADGTTDAFRSGLQSLERMEIVAAVSIAVAVLSAVGTIAAVAAGWGLVGAVGLSTAVSLMAIPGSWLILRRHVHVAVRASVRAAVELMRASLPWVAVGVMTFAIGYLDALVVRGFKGDEATGLYGAAYRIIAVMAWIPMTFQFSVYRTISHLAARAHDEFGRFVERSTAGLWLAALPITVGGLFVGGRVLTLVFGHEYAPGTEAFRILLVSLPFAFAGRMVLSALLVDDHPAAAGWMLGIAFVGNLGLNLALVPHFGIDAAAWITVGTEAFLALAATLALARRGVRPGWPVLAAPGLAAAALMAAAVYPLRHATLILPVVVGGAVYVAALLALRVPRLLGLRLPVPWRSR